MHSFLSCVSRYTTYKILWLAGSFASILIFTGCGVLKESPKYGFNEGYYKSRLFKKKLKKVYVVPVGY
jgi:hypothetical protein